MVELIVTGLAVVTLIVALWWMCDLAFDLPRINKNLTKREKKQIEEQARKDWEEKLKAEFEEKLKACDPYWDPFAEIKEEKKTEEFKRLTYNDFARKYK